MAFVSGGWFFCTCKAVTTNKWSRKVEKKFNEIKYFLALPIIDTNKDITHNVTLSDV